MNYVYILRCGDNSLYCGWTTNLEARIVKHNAGLGAKYTRSRLPYEDRHTALSREWHLKQLKREEKLRLIGDGKKTGDSP